MLNEVQVSKLLEPINPARVSQHKGQSHVEAYEIRAHLNRMFGFCGWSADVQRMEVLYDDPIMDDVKKRIGWWVGYRAQLRLVIYDPEGAVLATYTEWASGKSDNQPSRGDAHDMAIKTAESQALKRAAMNLGDQFGLGLYNKGKLSRIVGRTLVGSPTTSEGGVDSHITEPLPPEAEAEFGLAEPPPDQRVTSQKPPVRTAEQIAADAEAGAPKGAKHHQFYARLSLEVITAGLKDAPSPIEGMSLKQFVDYQEEAHRG